MARWNKEDIPHKGWKYIGIEELGEDVSLGEEIRKNRECYEMMIDML